MKLNLGSGVKLRKGFVNVDIIDESEVKGKAKYVKADIRKLPFKNGEAEYVELFTVIEHLPFRDIVPALKEIHRVMKKGGRLIIVTDNFDGIITKWFRMRLGGFKLEEYQKVMEHVYGNQHHEGEFHKAAMTPDFLNWCLVKAGFTKGDILTYPQNSPIPEIGLRKAPKNKVFRVEMIIADVKK